MPVTTDEACAKVAPREGDAQKAARRSYITSAVISGRNPKQVAAEVGHTTMRMITEVYDAFIDPTRWPDDEEIVRLADIYGWEARSADGLEICPPLVRPRGGFVHPVSAPHGRARSSISGWFVLRGGRPGRSSEAAGSHRSAGGVRRGASPTTVSAARSRDPPKSPRRVPSWRYFLGDSGRMEFSGGTASLGLAGSLRCADAPVRSLSAQLARSKGVRCALGSL